MDRIDKIRKALESSFKPHSLELEDESHLHAGHAGAATGRGHFKVRIVADAFAGTRAIERHRMVYKALGDLMQTDIHALSIDACAPKADEA